MTFKLIMANSGLGKTSLRLRAIFQKNESQIFFTFCYILIIIISLNYVQEVTFSAALQDFISISKWFPSPQL